MFCRKDEDIYAEYYVIYFVIAVTSLVPVHIMPNGLDLPQNQLSLPCLRYMCGLTGLYPFSICVLCVKNSKEILSLITINLSKQKSLNCSKIINDLVLIYIQHAVTMYCSFVSCFVACLSAL